MKITKIGHCCLLVEVNGLRILTDPGTYNSSVDDLENIDLILITHEHSDHLHIDSVKALLANNPNVKIITNSSVGRILDKEGIEYDVVTHQQSTLVDKVEISGFGEDHADVYPSLTLAENTGYLINQELFYPGDAFTDPEKPVRILALPVAGPWMKISEAIDYAKKLSPEHAFPVHDGMLKHLGPVHALPQKELGEAGIDFRPMSEGDTQEF